MSWRHREQFVPRQHVRDVGANTCGFGIQCRVGRFFWVYPAYLKRGVPSTKITVRTFRLSAAAFSLKAAAALYTRKPQLPHCSRKTVIISNGVLPRRNSKFQFRSSDQLFTLFLESRNCHCRNRLQGVVFFVSTQKIYTVPLHLFIVNVVFIL